MNVPERCAPTPQKNKKRLCWQVLDLEGSNWIGHQLPTRDVAIAVRVRLGTATFFGYAQLRTAGCEGDARLRTVDHQCIPELF